MTHEASPPQPPAAGPYVMKKLLELDAELAAAAPQVLEEHDDGIHALRVAIRRLRTMLKMARPLFGRWHADAVRKAFADVMRATGDLRDEEVLEETLEGVCEDPAFTSWLEGRAAREQKLRKNVVLRIERGDLDRARLMLKALLVFPFDPERAEDLSRFARRTVERARRIVEKGRDVPPEDTVGLHDLRICYKELRYSIELLSDALPLDARALCKRMVECTHKERIKFRQRIFLTEVFVLEFAYAPCHLQQLLQHIGAKALGGRQAWPALPFRGRLCTSE